jgi:titin
VAGNYLGTNAFGDQALGNGSMGVYVYGGAQDNLVGTNGDGVGDRFERNIISANGIYGVGIQGAGTDDNVVAGNFIGTDVTGTLPLGNLGRGVAIFAGAEGNRIGTNGDGVSDATEKNVISSNTGFGLSISDAGTTQNVVAGNFIGTDKSGTQPLGNGQGGVLVYGGAQGNSIGGSRKLGNMIAFNQGAGVSVQGATTTGNPVEDNSIHDNTGTAIDVTTGPPLLLNAPVIQSASPGSSTTVAGTLHSQPNTTYTIDFYASASPGQGQRYLRSIMITTDASGDATISAVLAAASASGEWLTATATDASDGTTMFSVAVQLATSGAGIAVPSPAATALLPALAGPGTAAEGAPAIALATAIEAGSVFPPDPAARPDGLAAPAVPRRIRGQDLKQAVWLAALDASIDEGYR